jgi:polysaccharide biosynthesis protein PelF
MNPISVLLTTEGTYPYASGGVSTWCDSLLRNTPEISYTLLPLMMNPHIEAKFEPPPNAKRIINVPMWGIEEPAEFITGIPFSTLFDRKKRTTTATIEEHFIPIFERFLRLINTPDDPASLGIVLVELEDYFARYDYNQTFKSQPVWRTFRATMESFSRAMLDTQRLPGASHQMPSLFDLTESLRWLFRFLIILNVHPAKTSVTHSTAAAFCGIPCITAKVRRGTPMLLTEHGVYLREQNLFLSRFRRLFFCKQFLLNLITAVVRANYHFADIVAPVCHYNTRWELAHATANHKIRVVYNGVDPDFFVPARRSAERLHVVATARIDPLKDIETLLRVAASVHETHPDVHFTIFGTVADASYYQRCLDLRRELRLEDVVTMGSPADDIVAAYGSADVILLTSVSEAFPYSVIEAMSCEKAVIASDVGGVREALEGCGILVAPRDDQRFSFELRALLDDRAQRARLGTTARQRVLEEFRLDHSIAQYVEMYEELGRRPAA